MVHISSGSLANASKCPKSNAKRPSERRKIYEMERARRDLVGDSMLAGSGKQTGGYQVSR